MLSFLLLTSLLTARPKEVDARLEVLRFHLERLKVIPVTADYQGERDRRIGDLEARLAGEVTSGTGVNEIYLSMDETRSLLLAHATEKPSLPEGSFSETETDWKVANSAMVFHLRKADLSFAVETESESWHSLPGCATDVVLRDGRSFSLGSARTKEATPFNTGYSVGMLVRLSGFPEAPTAELVLGIHLVDSEAVIELTGVKDLSGLAHVDWPKAVVFSREETDLSVIPMMQGILVPGNWPVEFARTELVESRSLYMPWWGQIRNGHGIQTIYLTPDDAGVDYRHPSGGPTRIQARWHSSLGGLRYPRRILLTFTDGATYVTMAKRYRRHVQETGRFVSLAEKRIRTPLLDEVIGRPVVHIGALYHNVPGARFHNEEFMEYNHNLTTFESVENYLRKLKKMGVEDAYVHLDGWGYYGYDNGHPDVIPPGYEQGGWEGLRKLADSADELGYLLAVHDQYRDFYLAAASYDGRLGVLNWDGDRTIHAEWAGGKQTYLSPRFQPGYVRRNHDAFRDHGIKIRGAYIDVFAVVPLEESFQENHPVTRTDCARFRRECLDLLHARGYVVSSEEPADYLARSMDLVHHGPYPTLPKGYGPGDALGISVPLWNLVYHDSVLIPWFLTDDGGWGIPNGDPGWLHCLLNAGLPYASTGYDQVRMDRMNLCLEMAGKVGTLEMVNHEFLDPGRRVQRTTFSDGTMITVDLENKTYTISPTE